MEGDHEKMAGRHGVEWLDDEASADLPQHLPVWVRSGYLAEGAFHGSLLCWVPDCVRLRYSGMETDSPYRARLTFRQRSVLCTLKVGMSEDGLRWTAPRRSQRVVERAFRLAAVRFWRDGSAAAITETKDGLVLDCPRGRMELRWLD